ncbi:PREDICTED: ubiquitin carboxyl-terminal hydrolase 30 homolog isoform X1 [Polistes canadensis]|uniref:ubiquitin carboxyl-terminal hydrolase 30 homolog isoform X1 n=2 Tax=Polistes canadensis TaxID=91411 RepID=UPI000718CFC7|nr:PREDICTED: ubiquitin carboxyl-terminal hydrolase 30 homolog isoform X1 [Polistes canadensis]
MMIHMMDIERIVMFAGMGLAVAVGVFILWGPSPKPRRRGKVVGISNLGYTCFLNSLLQALAACPTFITWLQKQREKNNKCQFTAALVSAFEKINGHTDDLYGDVTTIEIITALGSQWSFAPGYQDAHELFHILLNALQAEIQTINRQGCLSDALPRNSVVVMDLKNSGDQIGFRSVSCNDIVSAERNPNSMNGFDTNCNNHMTISTPSISSHIPSEYKPGKILDRSSEMLSQLKRYDTENEEPIWNYLCKVSTYLPPIWNEVHPFSGLLTSQLQCINCNWKTPVRYDKLESISLPLPAFGPVLQWKHLTLIELFSRFVSSEVVHDVECDGCASRCDAVKTLTLGKLPKCLCIHIPRTTWSSSGRPIKRDDAILFSVTLILDPFTFIEAKKRLAKGDAQAMLLLTNQQSTNGKHKYQLQAVVEHRGSVDAGHFVCYRRGTKPGQWLYTSDSTVEHISLTDVLRANPYLLFYERIHELNP